jgi:NAD(P)-dependent dehydrogenase (short-subunit alcohol dehydrogenase family)
MKTVAGKTVLITGAAMGLGKLFAQKAVDEKARTVVVWDVDEDALGQTVAGLEAAGGVVHGAVVDVAGSEAVAAAAARVRADVGTVEIVFNNAGIVRGNGYFWETSTVRDIEQTMAVNSLAPMFLAREFLPDMIGSDTDCRIVNIASSAGLLANPRMAVYAASKWALVGWSDSVRLELAQAGYDKVKVTTVCPTYINTGMFDGAKGVLFTPMLKQEAVVAATWRGMLQGEPFVVMPWTSRLNNAVKGLLPVKVRDFYLDRAGV